MKIKTNQKLNLPELIQYVWGNDIWSNSFKSNLGVEVVFSKNRKVFMNDYVDKDDTFTVEVEEELTEKTLLKDVELIGLIRRDERRAYYEMGEWSCPPNACVSISGIKEIYDLKSLHKINGDGSLTLLYTEENGIVKP